MPAVTLRLDPDQPHQRAAIAAVVDLFAGQEAARAPEPDPLLPRDLADLVVANSLTLDPAVVEANLRRVQDRPALGAAATGPGVPDALRIPWDGDPDFSVEMETGTGKTYVYLRTIAELHRRYGWSKFVVVVPTVAIREGVRASLRQLAAHLRSLYDGLRLEGAEWDSAHPHRVVSFASASTLQVLVMTIDAFARETTVATRADPDRLGGYAPIEYLRACRPVVILDEPQHLGSDLRQQAIASLRPLVRLRYSATHRDRRHLVHRLTPVAAYDQRLVKRIGVLSVVDEPDPAGAQVEVLAVRATARSVTARARILRDPGARPATVTLHAGDDLHELSGGRVAYRGWRVADIGAPGAQEPGWVQFENGVRRLAGPPGVAAQREMVHQAVVAHLRTELELRERLRAGLIPAPIKPLTLLLVDRVAAYAPDDGRVRRWLEASYAALRHEPRFAGLALPDADAVHAGYFATRRGRPTDVAAGRDSREASEAYALILRERDRLLSPEEPLRIIVSHSALAEGWDNPNVFTICTLQETGSPLRRRQQVGRGLRLPVMADGRRCHDPDVNLLTVIAHEGFGEFAAGLQAEIEDETGVGFDSRILDLRQSVEVRITRSVLASPHLGELWARVGARTRTRVSWDTDALVAEAVRRIDAQPPVEPVRMRVAGAVLRLDDHGVHALPGAPTGPLAPMTPDEVAPEGVGALDVVGELCGAVPLSRATIVRILGAIGDLSGATRNPAAFVAQTTAALLAAMHAVSTLDCAPDGAAPPLDRLVAGMAGSRWARPELIVGSPRALADPLVCASVAEAATARALAEHPDVLLIVRLPAWFEVPTPAGPVHPRWALAVRDEAAASGARICVVAPAGLSAEGARGLQAHYDALGVRIGAPADLLDRPAGPRATGQGPRSRG